jgi:hypothetical protein
MNTQQIEQNYFKHDSTFFKQTQVLAVGALTSPLFSENYLQWLEYNKIKNIASTTFKCIFSTSC